MLNPDLSRSPALVTPRMVLRELVEADAPAIFRLRSEPRVMRYIPKPLSTRTEEAHALIREFQLAARRNESIMWGITRSGQGQVEGYIGFWRFLLEHHRAELGYALHPDLWGQGLMSEAVAAVLDHGFRVLRLHSVEACVTPGNDASIRVLQRNGFVQEAHFRENFRHEGVFVDSLVYSCLAPAGA